MLRGSGQPLHVETNFWISSHWHWRQMSWFPWQPLLPEPRPIHRLHQPPKPLLRLETSFQRRYCFLNHLNNMNTETSGIPELRSKGFGLFGFCSLSLSTVSHTLHGLNYFVSARFASPGRSKLPALTGPGRAHHIGGCALTDSAFYLPVLRSRGIRNILLVGAGSNP
jgi:hypothetical protein